MRIPGNFDRWMFNYKEGNLSKDEMTYFEDNILSDPNYAQDIEAWENAFVQPFQATYPKTNTLIKDKPFHAKWQNWAAILLLLMSVGGGIGIGQKLLSEQNHAYQSRLQSHLSNFSNATATDREAKLSSQLQEPSTEGQSTSPTSQLLAANLDTGLGSSHAKSNRHYQSDSYNVQATTDNDDETYEFQTYHKRSRGGQETDHQKLEAEKIKGQGKNYTGTYALNPTFDVQPLDLNINKRKTGAFAFRLKRFLRQIDKISGYPIALVNLRDPELLIPNKNILNFNPGFAGSSGNFRIGADYRNQWTSESVNSQLGNLYFDTYNSGSRGGIGGSIVYGDYNNGVYQNMTANLYYSPKFALSKRIVFEPAIKVSMGKQARNIQHQSGPSAIEFDRGNVVSQVGIETISSNNSWYKDYGIGFVLNTDWFYVGGFIDNLAKHDQRIFTPLANEIVESPHLMTAVIGFDYQSRNKRTTLSPFLTYYQFGAKKEAWAGATAQFNWLTIGASYSSNSEYAASVGLKFKTFKLSYQLDMTESEFLQESFVSHNIGIRFNTKNKTIR